MKLLKKIILLIILLIIVIFAAQNFAAVTIRFLKWSIELPIAVTLLGIYALGAITGGLVLSAFKKVVSMDTASKESTAKKDNSPSDSRKGSADSLDK
ncbi:MAG: LapA family protein [Bacteroidales bacterium]|nr:LapA family protein [Bacteroidales bacterium]